MRITKGETTVYDAAKYPTQTHVISSFIPEFAVSITKHVVK